jgi:hypothetical protein
MREAIVHAIDVVCHRLAAGVQCTNATADVLRSAEGDFGTHRRYNKSRRASDPDRGVHVQIQSQQYSKRIIGRNP